jgi:hypothetical protein
LAAGAAFCFSLPALAAGFTPHIVTLGPVPLDFILFACVLLGIALFHQHTFNIAVGGLVAITLYKLAVTGFKQGAGFEGLVLHLGHEWVTLANLLGLLLGFALLSKHFEDSRAPDILPHYLPDDWKGGFVLLVLVFVLSAFLDNIAAALIGGTVAAGVFRHKVHIGYLAAIVAASNAGGSGSVVGDTTTTMMWIDGVSPIDVLGAYEAAVVALLFFGVFAARQQQAYNPITKDSPAGIRVDWTRLGIVGFILLGTITGIGGGTIRDLLLNIHPILWVERPAYLGIGIIVSIIVDVGRFGFPAVVRLRASVGLNLGNRQKQGYRRRKNGEYFLYHVTGIIHGNPLGIWRFAYASARILCRFLHRVEIWLKLHLFGIFAVPVRCRP